MKKKFGRASRSYISLAVIVSAMLFLLGIANINLRQGRIIGVAEILLGIAVICIALIFERRRRNGAEGYIKSAIKNGVNITNSINSLPMPLVIANADGSVRLYNDRFSELFSNMSMYGAVLDTILPDIKWGEILRSGEGLNKRIVIHNRQYDLISRIINENVKGGADAEEHLVYIYLVDRTEELAAIKSYEDERTDVAVICIDNYDELFQRMNNTEEQEVSAELKKAITAFAGESNAVLKKLDRDRYYMFFEHRYLGNYIDKKFVILENVRKIGESVKQPVSVSIGIGTGNNLSDNEQAARMALDMAQGRGGDQVGLKDDTQYKFFGGKSKEYEKSTRVKTRAVATALKDYILGADNVIFAGHKNADYDCFGAAMGLQRAVRELGKTPYIIHNPNSPAIEKLYSELTEVPEYKGMFVDVQAALEKMTELTLVIVLDTHRPIMLETEEIVNRASKVVLIDHHRRSTEFINNCSLIYHEPYASSTCEMVTEILQYMSIGSAVTAGEAECLYTGILLDTKNFLVKTGVRTFEAASYLRRLGLNTFDVKKLFNVDKDEYDRRAEIIRTAIEVVPNFAVAYTYDEFPNIRVIAAQAADEMLNINSVKASFVVYSDEGRTCVSARALNDVNVHLIMEALGGGGHATVAGVQRDDVMLDEMIELLRGAITDYLEANK